MLLHRAHKDAEAVTGLQKAIDLDPTFWISHLMLGQVYTTEQKYPEAIAEFGKAAELSHGNSEAVASVGYAAALAGDKTKARAVLEQLKNSGRYVPPVNIALVYNGLDKQDEALAALDEACEQRDVRLSLLKVDRRWDSFRSNPRFLAVLKRIGLQ
jgi:Flp pilus assembly protein TadD